MTYITPIFIIVVAMLGSYNCWVVINDIDFNKLTSPTYMEMDLDDDLNIQKLSGSGFALIYPGTKWCGAGNIANDYDDLGTEREADMCCRAHDHCPDSIPAGETKYNLTNDAFYTRLSCKCDDTFRTCLRSADTEAAKKIGILYFNALGTKCYRLDYPITGCLKYGGWLKKKCLKYSYDTKKEKIYQWFDVSNF